MFDENLVQQVLRFVIYFVEHCENITIFLFLKEVHEDSKMYVEKQHVF